MQGTIEKAVFTSVEALLCLYRTVNVPGKIEEAVLPCVVVV